MNLNYKILFSTITTCYQLIAVVVDTIHKTDSCLWFIVFGVPVRPYGDIPNRTKFPYVVEVFVFQTKIIPYVPSIN